MDQGEQYFRFEWNTFDSKLVSASKDLFREKTFTDVTLVSDDLQMTAVHRFVLARASSTFKKLFLVNCSADAMLYLKRIKQAELDLVLQFIYTGEVDVPTDRINDFLEAANDLDISELKNRSQTSDEEPITENLDSDADDYQERKIPEAECFDRAEDGVMLRGQENSDDSPSFLAVSYPCQEERCRETFSTKINLRNHMENHHKTNRKTKIAISKSKNVKNLICTSCDKTFTDQLSYLKHMRFGHK